MSACLSGDASLALEGCGTADPAKPVVERTERELPGPIAGLSHTAVVPVAVETVDAGSVPPGVVSVVGAVGECADADEEHVACPVEEYLR